MGSEFFSSSSTSSIFSAALKTVKADPRVSQCGMDTRVSVECVYKPVPLVRYVTCWENQSLGMGRSQEEEEGGTYCKDD